MSCIKTQVYYKKKRSMSLHKTTEKHMLNGYRSSVYTRSKKKSDKEHKNVIH